jgi:hypothetical protein
MSKDAAKDRAKDRAKEYDSTLSPFSIRITVMDSFA